MKFVTNTNFDTKIAFKPNKPKVESKSKSKATQTKKLKYSNFKTVIQQSWKLLEFSQY